MAGDAPQLKHEFSSRALFGFNFNFSLHAMAHTLCTVRFENSSEFPLTWRESDDFQVTWQWCHCRWRQMSWSLWSPDHSLTSDARLRLQQSREHWLKGTPGLLNRAWANSTVKRRQGRI